MRDLREEYFGEPNLGNHTLSEVNGGSFTGSTPEDWVYVRARSQSRDAPLYSEGVYRVLSTTQGSPLTDEGVETLTLNEVKDRMPRSARQRRAIPSIRGEYLTIKEVGGSENSDGTIEPTTRGRSTVIPVEFVIEPLSYDSAMVELID